MEMVDLKLPMRSEKEMKESCEPCCIGSSQPRYPYGLQLRFEKEQIDKIPSLMEYKIGDKVIITAEAEVTEVRKIERQTSGVKKNQDDYTVEMQVKQVVCVPKIDKKPEKMTPQEYKKFRSTM
jgi:hypothetical protein